MIVRKRKAALSDRPERNYQAIHLSLVRKLSNSGLKNRRAVLHPKKRNHYLTREV